MKSFVVLFGRRFLASARALVRGQRCRRAEMPQAKLEMDEMHQRIREAGVVSLAWNSSFSEVAFAIPMRHSQRPVRD